jgi:hypothetical protein
VQLGLLLQVSDLLPERGNLDVAVSNRSRDRAEHVVGNLRVVAEQRRGGADERDVSGGHDLYFERGDIGRESRQLAAAAEGNDDHAAQDGGGSNEQHHWHTDYRAMLVRMMASGPGGQMPAPTALLAMAGSLSEAIAAVRAGADLVDLVDLDDQDGTEQDTIGQLRARCPRVLVCGSGHSADLVRDRAVALATGARLICAGRDAALASGLPARQVIVEVGPAAAVSAARAGWATLVDADRAAELAAGQPGGEAAVAGIVAIAALSSWLGAAVVATRHPLPVARALQMAASIQGTRPPARTVRGLA